MHAATLSVAANLRPDFRHREHDALHVEVVPQNAGRMPMRGPQQRHVANVVLVPVSILILDGRLDIARLDRRELN